MQDVVIARPIHHAMPAGMRWGQSRTTQLQPVLVCCARLHCVPTMFCCLLLDFLCSGSLVFPSACFLLRLCSVADFSSPFSSLSSSFALFLNLLLKLSLNDLLQHFEQNISISRAFVVFFFVSFSLKPSTLSFAINCHIFSFYLFIFSSCGAAACRAIVPAASFHPHLTRSHQLDSCD